MATSFGHAAYIAKPTSPMTTACPSVKVDVQSKAEPTVLSHRVLSEPCHARAQSERAMPQDIHTHACMRACAPDPKFTPHRILLHAARPRVHQPKEWRHGQPSEARDGPPCFRCALLVNNVAAPCMPDKAMRDDGHAAPQVRARERESCERPFASRNRLRE